MPGDAPTRTTKAAVQTRAGVVPGWLPVVGEMASLGTLRLYLSLLLLFTVEGGKLVRPGIDQLYEFDICRALDGAVGDRWPAGRSLLQLSQKGLASGEKDLWEELEYACHSPSLSQDVRDTCLYHLHLYYMFVEGINLHQSLAPGKQRQFIIKCYGDSANAAHEALSFKSRLSYIIGPSFEKFYMDLSKHFAKNSFSVDWDLRAGLSLMEPSHESQLASLVFKTMLFVSRSVSLLMREGVERKAELAKSVKELRDLLFANRLEAMREHVNVYEALLEAATECVAEAMASLKVELAALEAKEEEGRQKGYIGDPNTRIVSSRPLSVIILASLMGGDINHSSPDDDAATKEAKPKIIPAGDPREEAHWRVMAIDMERVIFDALRRAPLNNFMSTTHAGSQRIQILEFIFSIEDVIRENETVLESPRRERLFPHCRTFLLKACEKINDILTRVAANESLEKAFYNPALIAFGPLGAFLRGPTKETLAAIMVAIANGKIAPTNTPSPKVLSPWLCLQIARVGLDQKNMGKLAQARQCLEAILYPQEGRRS